MRAPWKDKIVDLEDIQAVLLDRKGVKVVVNGCFDVLHLGHIHLLYEAKHQGEVLICALNDDAYIKRNKGEGRPVHSLDYRQKMMASLGCVDFVTAFSEDTPNEVLRVIKPEIYVNGSDYGESPLEKKLIEEWDGKVHVVSLVQDFSTSDIIKKIQNI